jgi:Tfp pilus assembly protein PilF
VTICIGGYNDHSLGDPMTTQFFLRCVIGLGLTTGMLAPGFAPHLFGQGIKPAGSSGAARSSISSNGQPANGVTTPDFSQHPFFLSGKVTMEDGTAPPDSATIQLVCHGSPRSIGHTDTKGGFSIDLNNHATQMTSADASENGSPSYGPVGSAGSLYSNTTGPGTGGSPQHGVADRDLMGCDVQAALAGFRSDIMHLSSRRSLDDADIGTMIMHRLANVEGTTISVTSAMAPKDAKKAMERAQNFLKKEKWADAQNEFEKAVQIYPKYAVAWAELGRVQEHFNNLEGARKSFAMALEADGKLVTPYLELALMAAGEEKWQEVSGYSDRALKLNPVDFPQAYLLNSMSNFYLKKMDAAEKSARAGIDHDPEHRFPKMNELLGSMLVEKQDYAGAAEQFRKYIRYAPEGSDTSSARKQLADLERSLSPQAKKQ